MKKIIENDINTLKYGPESKTLSIFCEDSIVVKARVTFDSCIIQGVQITYWMDDENIEERISSIFSILFEEVIKTRELKRIKALKN